MPPRQTIGIDCRFASSHSGIGRYTRELVRYLLKRNDPWRYVLFVRDKETHGLGKLPANNNYQFSIINYPFYSLSEQLFFPNAIRRANVTLMHFPHFNVPFLLNPAKHGVRSGVIATIHDLILHRFPNEASFTKRIAYRLLMRRTVQRASHLIAVSQATADDLASVYGENIREKLSIIHEGIADTFTRAEGQMIDRVRKKYQLPPSFLLYVGAAKEHKNVQTLIDTCPPEHTLVLVTSGKEIANLRLLPNVRVLPNLPDSDLPALYSAARCLISPSLSEGFNFPVLEAMACGCPVIATNRGSTSEVTGGFALLVEPTIAALSKALANLPTRPLEAAIVHAQSFSWERTAEETTQVYASFL